MKPYIKHKLEEIRNSHESVKHVWLYGLSGISMATVVALWLGYVSLTIPEVSAPQENSAVAAVTTPELGRFSIFMAGLNAVADGTGARLSRGIATVKNIIFGNPKTITIAKAAPRIIMKGLEDLPEGKLPTE